MRELDSQVLFLVQDRERPHKCQICRILNGRELHYCGNKSCFANARKRRTRIIRPHNCRVPLQTLVGVMRRLEKKGLILTRREKKPDGDNNRGYDYFSVAYSTGRYWYGRGDLPDRPMQLSLEGFA